MGSMVSFMRSSLASTGCSLFCCGGCDDILGAVMSAAYNVKAASMLCEICDGCVD